MTPDRSHLWRGEPYAERMKLIARVTVALVAHPNLLARLTLAPADPSHN